MVTKTMRLTVDCTDISIIKAALSNYRKVCKESMEMAQRTCEWDWQLDEDDMKTCEKLLEQVKNEERIIF